jgi:hypothetical protein
MFLSSVSLSYFCTHYLIFFRDSRCNQTAVRNRSSVPSPSMNDVMNQCYQLRPNWSCSENILYFSRTLFNKGNMRPSVFIKLKICHCTLNNNILHFMSLIMFQYEVHINTSESKFSTSYLLHTICHNSPTFQSILVSPWAEHKKACFSDVTYVLNWCSPSPWAWSRWKHAEDITNFV